MPASYPSSIFAFTTVNNGDVSDASQIDNPVAEIIAVETGLLNGTQHNVKPLTDNTYDLGDASHAWRNLYAKGTTQLNGQAYMWPGAQTAGTILRTDGSGTLSWAPAVLANDFRLSLTTATPVTTSDVTAATTLYWTPYVGNRITLFDGSGTPTTFTTAELSIAVPATTSQMYDVFVYNNAGTPTLELLAWTNDTTRATALVRTNGRYTKSGDSTRLYVGSFRTTTVSGQTEDSALKRFVWNAYHRVTRPLVRQESTASWTYSTATVRQANGSTANQVAIVVGLAEDEIDLNVIGICGSTLAGEGGAVSIGENGTTSEATAVIQAYSNTAVNSQIGSPAVATLRKIPPIGYSFYAWLEYAASPSGTVTWRGVIAHLVQAGMTGMWKA